MDSDNEMELDKTTEKMSRHKLRSSLKKSKPRNPLGNLDISDADFSNAPRRVSFASSNYVKPFLNDPDQNTIWDNTYEEEVNHTDSTNHSKTEIQSKIENKADTDQCFDKSLMVNDFPEELLSNVETNATMLSKQKCSDMELTCQWDTNIISRENAEQKSSARKNVTIYQPVDMSMTLNDGIQDFGNKENIVIETDLEKSPKSTISDNNYTHRFQTADADMEFTCMFQNNILEPSNTNLNKSADMEFTCKFDTEIKVAEIVPLSNNMIVSESKMAETDTLTCLNSVSTAPHNPCNSTTVISNDENKPLQPSTSCNKESTCVLSTVFDHDKENILLPNIPVESVLSQDEVHFMELNGNVQCTFKKPSTYKTNDQKPLKTREFGDIPIAVDSSDLSLDYVSDQNKTSANVQTHSKENTYTIIKDKSDRENIMHGSLTNNSYDDDKHTVSLQNEECSLVSSLPSFNENDLVISTASSSNGKKQEIEVKKDDSLLDEGEIKMPLTKVIYSEPMGVKAPISGINTFNFSSITNIEDTQQLIQATFSKPSFERSDISEGETSSISPLIDKNKSDDDKIMEIEKSVSDGSQNETAKVQSILANIGTKLIRCEFQELDSEDDSEADDQFYNELENFISTFKFPDLKACIEEFKRRHPLPDYCPSDENSGSDLSEDESLSLEPELSLHEKIVGVCQRSNNMLYLEHAEENVYKFTTLFDRLNICVEIHPEDGRVVEIKTTSLLRDSAENICKFLMNHFQDKLKPLTLQSHLGPYYDVLTLLDYICLTMDETVDFQWEFFSLQKLYYSLKMTDDFRICLEILHNCPAIFWTIKLKMISPHKINSEDIELESKWGSINDEHIKQIIRNLDEGVHCLRNFISNLVEYFKRTQLKKLQSKQ